MPVSIGGSENPGNRICAIFLPPILLLTLCQWFRTLYNTQKAIQENQDATIDAFAVICGPIIPTGRLWLLQDIMRVLIGAPKNAGYRWCRLPISASTILTVSLVYKLHLKHECQYNTYLIRVLRCQE